MGNSVPALLKVEIEDNGSMCAGGRVRGKVLLNVQRGFNSDFLMFHFYGQERVHVCYPASDNSGEQLLWIVKQQSKIHSTEIVLHRFEDGHVTIGHHVFHFDVDIPSGLPGSQSYEKNYGYCGIEYFCTAKLHLPGMFASDVKESCEVLINDKPYETFPVPLVLFMDDGRITFSGKVNTSDAYGNETIRLNYAIRNDSISRVEALELDITCHISFKAGTRSCSQKHSVFHKRVEGASILGFESLKMIRERNSDYDALLDLVNEGKCGVDIPIDDNIRPTYTGLLSSVTHELSVTIKTTLASTNTVMRFPIIVHRRLGSFAFPPKVDRIYPNYGMRWNLPKN